MSKGMKERQILAIVKEPGKEPRVEPLFESSPHALQEVVGGYIETVTFCEDLVIICNEEGRLMGLPHNCEVCGVDFVGTIVAVGTKGEDFASLKASVVPGVLKMLGGKDGKQKRLIEIPADGIVPIPIMQGDSTVGERRIDLSFFPVVDAVEVVRCKDCFADGCCSVQIDLEMGGEGYCPKGKRRTEDA